MEITNLMLLSSFRECAHIQFHRPKQFRGQGRILVLLKERERMTQRELTLLIRRRSATLSEQLENMEKSGWIVREKCPTDKRNLEIRLTELGNKMAQEAETEREKEADDLFGALDQEDKESLYKVLKKLGSTWSMECCETQEEIREAVLPDDVEDGGAAVRKAEKGEVQL